MGSERASTIRRRLAGKICATCGVDLPQVRTHGHGERQCATCCPPTPRPFKVRLFFESDKAGPRGSFVVTFFLPDGKTTVGKRYRIAKLEYLQAVVNRTEPPLGTLEELNRNAARNGRGFVDLLLTDHEFRDLAAGKSKAKK